MPDGRYESVTAQSVMSVNKRGCQEQTRRKRGKDLGTRGLVQSGNCLPNASHFELVRGPPDRPYSADSSGAAP
jgi:hypothetical protein